MGGLGQLGGDRRGLTHLRWCGAMTRALALDALLREGDAADRAAAIDELWRLIINRPGGPLSAWLRGALGAAAADQFAARAIVRDAARFPGVHGNTLSTLGRAASGDGRTLGPERLARAIGELLSPRERETLPAAARAGLVRAIGAEVLSEHAGLVVPLLADADDRVAESAEDALLDLARLANEAAPGAAAPARRTVPASVVAAVARALDRLGADTSLAANLRGHRRAGVLLAAAKLVQRGVPLHGRWAGAGVVEWLTDASNAGEHPAILAAQRSLRKSERPSVALLAWTWLRFPALASAAADRLFRGDGGTIASPGAGAAPGAGVVVAVPGGASGAAAPGAGLAAIGRQGAELSAGLRHVLERAHLALLPARAAALGKLVTPDGRGPEWLLNALVPIDSAGGQAISPAGGGGAGAGVPPGPLPVASRLGAVWLIGALPVSTRWRDQALAAVLTDPDAAVRHAAVRAAARAGGPLTPTVLDQCFDADAGVSRSAAGVLLARTPGPGVASPRVRDAQTDQVVAALRRSPSAGAAGLGRTAEHAYAAEPIVRADHPAARLVLRRRMLDDPTSLRIELGKHIDGDDPACCAGAIIAARWLGLAPGMSARVSALLERRVGDRIGGAAAGGRGDAAWPAWERALATAVAALGDASDGQSAGLLRTLADQSAGRVRANAIDALVRRARTGADTALPAQRVAKWLLASPRADLAAEPEHRPRANAARGLIVLAGALARDPARRAGAFVEAGARVVAAMVRDERPAHRLAGLWLAERAAPSLARFSAVIDAVTGAARGAEAAPQGGEPTAVPESARSHEHQRAQRAAARLVVCVRGGWRSRAATLQGAEAAGQAASLGAGQGVGVAPRSEEAA